MFKDASGCSTPAGATPATTMCVKHHPVLVRVLVRAGLCVGAVQRFSGKITSGVTDQSHPALVVRMALG
jgi:hypothetical protein